MNQDIGKDKGKNYLYYGNVIQGETPEAIADFCGYDLEFVKSAENGTIKIEED